MKKLSLIFIIFFISLSLYAQVVDEEITLEYINRCSNYLNNPVPFNFIKTNRQTNGLYGIADIYENQTGDIMLHVNNKNIVYFSSFGLLFTLTSAANRFHTMIFDIIETTGWEFYGKGPVDDTQIYIKNDVAAMIRPIRRRSLDNMLTVSVIFITEPNFLNYFDYK